MNLHDMQSAIEELKREKWTHAKRHEMDAVMRMVDGLESTLREARSEIDGLRYRVQELEANQLKASHP